MVGAAGAGYLVGRELDAEAAERTLEAPLDHELVWHAIGELLEELGPSSPRAFERPRRWVAEFDQGLAEVQVEHLAVNRTSVRVRAVRGLGLAAPQLAADVAASIEARLATL
jgi:hypothetical protein